MLNSNYVAVLYNLKAISGKILNGYFGGHPIGNTTRSTKKHTQAKQDKESISNHAKRGINPLSSAFEARESQGLGCGHRCKSDWKERRLLQPVLAGVYPAILLCERRNRLTRNSSTSTGSGSSFTKCFGLRNPESIAQISAICVLHCQFAMLKEIKKWQNWAVLLCHFQSVIARLGRF